MSYRNLDRSNSKEKRRFKLLDRDKSLIVNAVISAEHGFAKQRDGCEVGQTGDALLLLICSQTIGI